MVKLNRDRGTSSPEGARLVAKRVGSGGGSKKFNRSPLAVAGTEAD